MSYNTEDCEKRDKIEKIILDRIEKLEERKRKIEQDLKSEYESLGVINYRQELDL